MGLAAKKATQALKTLKEAVDSAEFVVQHGIFEDADVSSLVEVEKASVAASTALSALEQARAHDPEQESRCHGAFGAKLNTLATTHQGSSSGTTGGCHKAAAAAWQQKQH